MAREDKGFTVRVTTLPGSRAPMVALKATRGALQVQGNFSVNASGQNSAQFRWLTGRR